MASCDHSLGEDGCRKSALEQQQDSGRQRVCRAAPHISPHPQALALPAPPEQARAERPAPLPVLPRAPEAVAAEAEARKKAEEAAARQR